MHGPPLVQSVTEDDDDTSLKSYVPITTTTVAEDPHAQLVTKVRSTNDREALAYLLRYETMVRQQEAEDMATLAHLRPCVERVQELASDDKKQLASDNEEMLTQEISFAELQTALERLELQPRVDSKQEFMTTDRQLMMVLRILTQKTSELDKDVCISWAEFLQCYKTCIVGMMTLQHLPSDSAVRSRARDRTLSMLSLFEPPSTKLFNENLDIDSGALTSARHAAVVGKNNNSHGPSKKRKMRRAVAAVVLVVLLVAGGFMASSSLFTMTETQPSNVKDTSKVVASTTTKDTQGTTGSGSSSSLKLTRPKLLPPTKKASLLDASLPSTASSVLVHEKKSSVSTLAATTTLIGGVVGFVAGPALVTSLGAAMTGSLTSTALLAIGGLSLATLVLRGLVSIVTRIFVRA